MTDKTTAIAQQPTAEDSKQMSMAALLPSALPVDLVRTTFHLQLLRNKKKPTKMEQLVAFAEEEPLRFAKLFPT